MNDDDDDEREGELDERYDDGIDDGANADGCCLGAACLNPHPYHLAYECFDLEMAEASMNYAQQEGRP